MIIPDLFLVYLLMIVKWFLFYKINLWVLNILLQQESKIQLLVLGLPQEAVDI